jgi:hypothetical protein
MVTGAHDGVQSANGMTVVRIPEQIVERSELTRDGDVEANDLLEIKSTVGRMDYMSPNYTIICARHT